MTVSATLTDFLTVTETLGTVPLVNPNNASIVHDQLNVSATYNGTTTVAVSVVVAETYALVGGVKTIDLTTLTGSNGAAVDATGLKVKIIKILNPTGNAAITIKAGATNPYLLFGASWSLVLQALQSVTAYLDNAAPAVGPTSKTIDMSGTGTQLLKIIFVFG